MNGWLLDSESIQKYLPVSNICQNGLARVVDFPTPVRNIASDYKMVTEMKQKEKKCIIECNPKHTGLLGT